MEENQQESPFIIKNEKYSLDIIIKYQTPNGIANKGITIYKKNCEINFLNEESLNELVNNKEKENNNNIIHSFANIGFISISDIICFLYVTKNDIVLLNKTERIEENIYYKIKNLQYIKMNEKSELNKEEQEQNFKNNFTQFKNFFLSENIYFSFCKYGNNILNHHIDSSNNYIYNEKYISLFQQTNTIEFITPLIKGFYRYLIIKDNTNQNNNNINNINNNQNINNIDNINYENNNNLEIEIKIRNKINKKEDNIIKIEDIINEKECFQEIQIGIYSNIINKTINYKFYSYYGKSFSDLDFIYSLINYNKKIQKGLILSALDYAYINDKNIKEENFIDILKKAIKNENLKCLFDIEIANDGKKDNIKKFVFENIDKIKNIFLKEENVENIGDKILIISGESDNSIFNLTQEIIYSILYFFFDKYLNKDDNNDNLLSKAKSSIENYFNFLDELLGKRTMKLVKFVKLKFPKIYFINKDYLKEKFNLNKNNLSNNNIEKEESLKSNFTIFILTYNVCAMNIENINSINFSELLFPEKSKKYFESNNNKNYPLFYCIGLEEVINLNPKNVIIGGEKEKYALWEEKISTELKSKINYSLLLKTNLVGILFFLFVQSSEISKIKNIKNTKTKTGFYGQLGNKGSCFIEFEYENKKYGFNSGHLTAGETIKNNNQRKNNLIKILNHQADKDSNEFYKNDFYFIFGDLNFRVQNSIKNIHKWLFNIKFEGKQKYEECIDEIYKANNIKNDNNKNNNTNVKNEIKSNKNDNNSNFSESNREEDEDEKTEDLFYQIDENVFLKFFGSDYSHFDQLNNFKEELTKYDIKEGNLSFPPTYKYAKNSNNYNLQKREPSWTDRILYKENGFIKNIVYDRINIHYSDHKPIFSLFEINY